MIRIGQDTDKDDRTSGLGKSADSRAREATHPTDTDRTENGGWELLPGADTTPGRRTEYTPKVVSHNAAISACGKGRHWEEALRLLKEMLQRVLTLDVVSYSAVISACEKGKHWEEALCLLQEMLHCA